MIENGPKFENGEGADVGKNSAEKTKDGLQSWTKILDRMRAKKAAEKDYPPDPQQRREDIDDEIAEGFRKQA